MPNLDDAIREFRRDVAPEGFVATWAVERFLTKLTALDLQAAPPDVAPSPRARLDVRP